MRPHSTTCSFPDCGTPVKSRDLCNKHYLRWWKTPAFKPKLHSLDRLAECVIISETGCWLWQGCRDSNGYGHLRTPIREGGKYVKAHLAVYRHLVGPVPEGLELDHLCCNPPCVNPDHLEPVTHEENMRRGLWATKRHCPQGHPYDETNTYIASRGDRQCRICMYTRNRNRRLAVGWR